MSRKKAYVIVTKTVGDVTTDVTPADGIFAVVFDGEPISLRQIKDGASRYQRTCFATKGHAVNLANRLNAFYSTGAFTVAEL